MELNPTTTTNMPQPSPSSRRAETAGMVPTRCLSPNGNRKGHKHGPGEPGIPSRAPSTTSLSRRSLREVPLEDCRLQKVPALPLVLRSSSSSFTAPLPCGIEEQDFERERSCWWCHFQFSLGAVMKWAATKLPSLPINFTVGCLGSLIEQPHVWCHNATTGNFSCWLRSC